MTTRSATQNRPLRRGNAVRGSYPRGRSISVLLDGITTLPRRHIATIKSYLRRDATCGIPTAALPQAVTLERLLGANAIRYRTLFADIGTRWLWWSRLLLPLEGLSAILDDSRIEAYAVVENGRDIGLLEWDFSQNKQPEIAFLGLTEPALGRGRGHGLMALSLERMGRDGIDAVRVNTCTFDHPAALGFYRRWGFAVIEQAIEIVPDPRLAGILPETAAPHVPILR